MCTGPVAIEGAKAGQVLEVRIKAIELALRLGLQFLGSPHGRAPGRLPRAPSHAHHARPRKSMTGRLPWGQELPLRPFFGVMAVAPPAAWGRVSTLPPRKNGGNLDNKELVAGTTLYLPIHVDGALFSVGDGHGAQGDGEVCVTAIETGLDRHLRAHRARRSAPRVAAGRDADPRHDHGLRSRPRRLRGDRAAPDGGPRRARRPASRSRRPTPCAASPPTCASPRSSTAPRAST